MATQAKDPLTIRSKVYRRFIDDTLKRIRDDVRTAIANGDLSDECSFGGHHTGFFYVRVESFTVKMSAKNGSFYVTVSWDTPWKDEEAQVDIREEIEVLTSTISVECNCTHRDFLNARFPELSNQWQPLRMSNATKWYIHTKVTSMIGSMERDEDASHDELKAYLSKYISNGNLDPKAELTFVYTIRSKSDNFNPMCKDLAKFINERHSRGSYTMEIPALWYKDKALLTNVATTLPDALAVSSRVNAKWIL